jgi:hypothetical protein
MLIFPKKNLKYTKLYIDKHPILYSRYLLKLLTIAIRDNLDEIVVFKIKDTETEGSMHRKNYVDALETAINHFIAHEEFELATEATDLLTTLIMDDLVNETGIYTKRASDKNIGL